MNVNDTLRSLTCGGGYPVDLLLSAAGMAGELREGTERTIRAAERAVNARPYYMGHSRKRFIKLAMSYGLQRNEAAILASQCRYMPGIDDIPTMISILDMRTRLPKDVTPLWMPEEKERRHWERLCV